MVWTSWKTQKNHNWKQKKSGAWRGIKKNMWHMPHPRLKGIRTDGNHEILKEALIEAWKNQPWLTPLLKKI